MGTPQDHLPKPLAHDAIHELLDSIGLPKATIIAPAKVTAAYHSIYMLSLPPSERTSHRELVLRVSGHHLPRIKTANEVGIMAWILKNTSIPIADLVAYDDSSNNPIAHEYTLLARVARETLSDIYSKLSEEQIHGILDQLADVLSQLHSHEWHDIGGLNLDAQGEIRPAQVVDETFWTVPELNLWPPSETVASLNISGPYASYVDYVSAQIRQYIHLIHLHDKLAFMRGDIPRLEAFLTAISSQAAQLNRTKLVLAHKDLHFANVLYDRGKGRITAILDWEFSGVVPCQLWNPRRAFLWNGQDGEASMAEKKRLWELFTARCEERNMTAFLEDTKFTSPLQEAMQSVADFLRAIVEVSPRGQRKELVPRWKATVLENIARFGV
ncbi:phosphotransferase enzyme family-domain-containing protein [Hypoxylon sp. FL0543]|nr:phosphotransferase enzyme family-domain-containing protein [Hypoxylon sp. FL0543]